MGVLVKQQRKKELLEINEIIGGRFVFSLELKSLHNIEISQEPTAQMPTKSEDKIFQKRKCDQDRRFHLVE